eukprot:7286858-Pyramimonas_sp.AAC.1
MNSLNCRSLACQNVFWQVHRDEFLEIRMHRFGRMMLHDEVALPLDQLARKDAAESDIGVEH